MSVVTSPCPLLRWQHDHGTCPNHDCISNVRAGTQRPPCKAEHTVRCWHTHTPERQQASGCSSQVPRVQTHSQCLTSADATTMQVKACSLRTGITHTCLRTPFTQVSRATWCVCVYTVWTCKLGPGKDVKHSSHRLYLATTGCKASRLQLIKFRSSVLCTEYVRHLPECR